MIKTITLRPSRIGCPSISGTMKGIVMSVPGVQGAKVHYKERSLDVTFDDGKASKEDIIKKIGRETGLAMETGETCRGKEGNVADACPM